MFNKLVKTAKFMFDWLDWSLLYPLWQTEVGREQIVRTALGVIKKHPEKLEEIRRLVDKIMGEDILKAMFARRAAADGAPNGPTIVTDVSGRHAPPPVPKVPEPPAPARGGGRTMSDLKTRLGLKKS